jgi:UDP-N-acetylmuramoylalanine--D-glutamate ligase
MSEKIIHCVLGPGISGVGASKLLKKMGYACLIVGDNDPRDWANNFKFLDEASLFFHEEDPKLDAHFEGIQYLILSPGIPRTHKLVKKALKSNIEVLNEIDLAFKYLKRFKSKDKKFIGVTGSNGKTTTVSLMNHFLITAGKKTFLGGNIGTPLSTFVSEEGDAGYYILELSSFQLESLHRLELDFGFWLNFTSTHEERYKKIKDYFLAKLEIFKLSKNKIVGTGLREEFDKYNISCDEFISPQSSILDEFSLDCWSLKGRHNLDNLMMAVWISQELGLTKEAIQSGINSFEPLEYRMQNIGRFNDSSFFNDSKSTNIESTIKAISGFDSDNLTLIIGGKIRDESLVDFERWRAKLEKVNKIIIFGEASHFFKKRKLIKNCAFYDSFFDLTSKDIKSENILFSPGFPSFDEFKNYVDRGRAFNNFFENLTNEKSMKKIKEPKSKE